jgi:hypothetical protein
MEWKEILAIYIALCVKVIISKRVIETPDCVIETPFPGGHTHQ